MKGIDTMKSLFKKIIFIMLAVTLLCPASLAMHRRMRSKVVDDIIPENQKIIFIRKNPSSKNSVIINVDENFFVRLIPVLTKYSYLCEFNQRCQITITDQRKSSKELMENVLENFSENNIPKNSIEIL